MLKAFCGIDKNVHVVKTDDIPDPGQGNLLPLLRAPDQHWFETMMTCGQFPGILFPCDASGTFDAIRDIIFDDQLSPEPHEFSTWKGLGYCANIIGGLQSCCQLHERSGRTEYRHVHLRVPYVSTHDLDA